jgi:hypothetical protein
MVINIPTTPDLVPFMIIIGVNLTIFIALSLPGLGSGANKTFLDTLSVEETH